MKTNRKTPAPAAWRIILRILGCLAAAVLVTFYTLMYVIPAFEKVDGTPVDGNADWMSRLGDELYLSEITLPGTHDSATKNVKLAFFSKCQALSVGEQLEAGFRYLDIRLAVDGDGMKLMHGFAECTVSGWPMASKLTLESVLEECYAFLRAHPTETVVFCVKQEHGDETAEQFAEILDDIIEKNSSFWFASDYIPRLGEARGRLVLVRRYGPGYGDNAGRSGIPLLWNDQGGRDDTSKHIVSHILTENGDTLWVQDRYKYDADEKWTAFLNGLSEGRNDIGETGGNISIHFLSTNGPAKFGHPYKYAKALNERFLTDDVALSGWVIVDFGSPALALKIIDANFS